MRRGRKKGSIPWNIGLTKETNMKIKETSEKVNYKDIFRQIGLRNKGKSYPSPFKLPEEIRYCFVCNQKFKIKITSKQKFCSRNCYYNNLKISQLGHVVSEKTKIKQSISKLNYFNTDPEAKLKIKLHFIKIGNDPKIKKQRSKLLKRRWKEDKNYINSFHKKPNKLEINLGLFLQTHFPNEWEYIGDGKFVIGGKLPDYININKKKIIELYGDYWHRNDNPQDRINLFKQYGYTTLVIWEHEMYKNLEELQRKIRLFTYEY